MFDPDEVEYEGLTSRRPPALLIDDVGIGFAAGAVGGFISHFLKGFFTYSYVNSTKSMAMDFTTRFGRGLGSGVANAPCLGGRWAVFVGLTRAAEKFMVARGRRPDDPIVHFLAGGSAAVGYSWLFNNYRRISRPALCAGALYGLCGYADYAYEYGLPKWWTSLRSTKIMDILNSACTYYYLIRGPRPLLYLAGISWLIWKARNYRCLYGKVNAIQIMKDYRDRIASNRNYQEQRLRLTSDGGE